MADSRFERIRQIFDGALERSGDEREAFLREACGEDAALRAEVEALLEADAELDDFLEPPQGFALPVEQLEEDAQHFLPEVEIGGYELIRELGRGGRGVVYLAREPGKDELVALKVLDSHMLPSAVAVERFRREARAVERLDHPGVVKIRRSGEDGGRPFLVMDYVAGRTLADELRILRHRLEGASLPPHLRDADPVLPVDERERVRKSVDLVCQVAEALHHAHAREILHRDVKPHNILLDAEGRVHLIDFGLAHLDDDLQLTRTGAVEGTPNYMSPEQVRAERERIDARTDVYSLGVVLYELLTLRRPFDAPTAERVMQNITRTVAPRLRKSVASAPAALELVCATAMEKRRRDRYASAAVFASDLAAVLAGRPIQARAPGPVQRLSRAVHRRPLTWAVSGAAAAALVLGGFTADELRAWGHMRGAESAIRTQSGADAASLDWRVLRERLALLPDGEASLGDEARDLLEGLRQRGAAQARQAIAGLFEPDQLEMASVSLGRTVFAGADPASSARLVELGRELERLGLTRAEATDLFAEAGRPRALLSLSGATWEDIAAVRLIPIAPDSVTYEAPREVVFDLRDGCFPVPRHRPFLLQLTARDGGLTEVSLLPVGLGEVRVLEIGLDRQERLRWVEFEGAELDGDRLAEGFASGLENEQLRVDGARIQETPITVRQFVAFLEGRTDAPTDWWGLMGEDRVPGRLDKPVTFVSHDEAAACAAWYGGRLPTMPEWAYALRGGQLPPLPPGLSEAELTASVEGGWFPQYEERLPADLVDATLSERHQVWLDRVVPEVSRDEPIDQSASGMRLGLGGVMEYSMTLSLRSQAEDGGPPDLVYTLGLPAGRSPQSVDRAEHQFAYLHLARLPQGDVGFRCAAPAR